jgi:hypothetical protein
MVKITPLADVNIISQSGPTINDNSDKIEAAFDNTISRDGSGPNQMEADLDLNSNDILNVGLINVTDLTIQGQNVSALIEASVTAVEAAIQAAISASNASISAISASDDAAMVASQLANLPDWKGPWLTATAYTLGDLVQESGNTYICIVNHTSGTFATDLSSSYWQLFAQKGASGVGTGDMLSTNNLSDVASPATARSNLGVPAKSVDSIIASNWTFNDSPTASIRFGTDQDVKMWWDNTNNIFAFDTQSNAAAQLKLRFPLIELMKQGGTETLAKFIADGGVELYYDAVKKFETLTGGAKVTGNMDADTVSGNWISTAGEATTGTINNKFMTPLRTQAALNDRITGSYGGSGYVSFKRSPTDVRLYLQWGRFSVAAPANSNQRVTYPIALSTAVLGAWLSVDGAAGQMIGITGVDNYGYTVQKGNGDIAAHGGWFFVIGT